MKTNDLVKSLNRFGVRADAYKRAPMGKDVFALSILPGHKEGVVTIHQGKGETEIFGSKTKRQAAVTVREPGRSVTRTVRATISLIGQPPDFVVHDRLKLTFQGLIVMSGAAMYTFSDVSVTRRYNPAYPLGPEPIWDCTGQVTATVKKGTINHFLIGMDETRNFISPLPQQAKSVKEAHVILRPKLRRGAKRQGEWFFEPCTAKERKELDKLIAIYPLFARDHRLGLTTHYAKTSIKTRLKYRRKMEIYARGFIQDRRTGHHKALWLGDWCKAVRNKEVAIKPNPSGRRRSWD